MLTITCVAIGIQSVSSVTAAGVGAGVVMAVVVAAIQVLSTLIDVCVRDRVTGSAHVQ